MVNRLAMAWMRRGQGSGKGHDHPTNGITRELYRLGDGCENEFAAQKFCERRPRVTRERIRQIEAKAPRKLKHPSRSRVPQKLP